MTTGKQTPMFAVFYFLLTFAAAQEANLIPERQGHLLFSNPQQASGGGRTHRQFHFRCTVDRLSSDKVLVHLVPEIVREESSNMTLLLTAPPTFSSAPCPPRFHEESSEQGTIINQQAGAPPTHEGSEQGIINQQTSAPPTTLVTARGWSPAQTSA